MSLKFSAGDLTIHRIVEQQAPFFPALELLPDLTPEQLAENRAWLKKLGAIDDSDTLILCFQSYIIKTPHHTILIDSCIGNDKPRPGRPNWHMKTDESYMRALKAAGFSVDDIDYVMCTHLHVDHVGWNTRMENGRWVPTFPKARYVFGKSEYDYWHEQNARAEVPGGRSSSAMILGSAITPASCRHRATRPAMSPLPSAKAGRRTPCSPAISCTRRCKRFIPNCRRNSTSIRSRRQ
jgi:glyoxylase-like metal-dependent hydrolase (beta-lactamase superfamily II)